MGFMRNNPESKSVEKKRSSIWIGAVFIVIALALGGYFLLQGQPKKPTGPLEKATLGVETSLLPAAVWVAENKGYFQEAGLDLNIKVFDSGRLSFLAMLRGEVDLSTVAPTPIMFSSFDRQDFSIIATFVYSYDDVKVIARKDKGINTEADLRGKRIGTPAGTTGQFFLAAFLTLNRILPSDVKIINISPSDLPVALANNRVDAVVIWEPHAYRAMRLLGNRAIRLPSSEVYRETFNFLATKDFVKDRPESLRRFLGAVVKATAFVNDHKEEAQAIVAERLKLDKETMIAVWDDFVFEISLDQSLLLTLEDEARWAIGNKLTDKTEVPNYLDFIYLDELEAVKPESVTIIR